MATTVRAHVIKLQFLAVVAVAVATLSGCETTRPLYHYGSYQDNVYTHFKNEDASVNQEIAALEKTISQSVAKKPAGWPWPARPPGLFVY